MGRYLLQRLIATLVVLLGISLIVFFVLRITGDPVEAMLAGTTPTKEAIAALTHAMGLDKPLPVQYWVFLTGLLHGNFGNSIYDGESVFQLIRVRMAATALLAVTGLVLGVALSVPLGVLAALHKGRPTDVGVRTLSLLGISFPSFWLGIMLVLIFAVKIHALPVAGYGSWKNLVLPGVTLGIAQAGIMTGLVRSNMIDVMNEQFIQTARAKGLPARAVIYLHGLRNALLPVVTYLGLSLGTLLGGVVIIEQVFAWPGIGELMITSINRRDYPVVQGGAVILALFIVGSNLLVDLCYTLIDPRIKMS
ncbi:MAG TPA: ABC transporter permease [Bacillota bacterium]|nr:ABC transporter permease [Bacillota bacterium]